MQLHEARANDPKKLSQTVLCHLLSSQNNFVTYYRHICCTPSNVNPEKQPSAPSRITTYSLKPHSQAHDSWLHCSTALCTRPRHLFQVMNLNPVASDPHPKAKRSLSSLGTKLLLALACVQNVVSVKVLDCQHQPRHCHPKQQQQAPSTVICTHSQLSCC